MVQVPEEMKDKIESYKGKFHAKTNYEVLQYLFNYYEQTEKWKAEQRNKAEQEKQHQAKTMVYLGEESKARFVETQRGLKLKNESSLSDFLINHFEKSPNMTKETFDFYKSIM